MSSPAYLAGRLLWPVLSWLIARMGDRERRHFARSLALPVAGRVESTGYQFLRLAYGFARNTETEIPLNGESDLVARLAPRGLATVVDVGANHGDWSRLVLSHSPQAAIHMFEIMPPIAASLRAQAWPAQAVINDVGLSDRQGELDIAFNPALDGYSGTHPPKQLLAAGFETVRCRVVTGDEYCRARAITSIDLLKVDAEGHDFNVLRGFATLIDARAIAAIQFEHSFAAIGPRVMLRDIQDWLEARGYAVGKLFPAGVLFATYDTEWEDYRGMNWVAVPAERADLIEAVRLR
jgi:FkbM family methyltransferase